MADAYVLVDYDNIPKEHQRFGDRYVITLIVDKFLEQLEGVQIKHLILRFYGGWYDEKNITRRAQILLRHPTFMTPEHRKQMSGNNVTSIKSELAKSLLSSKNGLIFYNTLRTRKISLGRYRADLKGHSLCGADPCFLGKLNSFFSTGKCQSTIDVNIQDYVVTEEQKLVDVLLSTDLLWLSQDHEYIGLVTSDDDFLPAIVSACECDVVKRLVHIKTQSGMTNNYLNHVNKTVYRLTSL